MKLFEMLGFFCFVLFSKMCFNCVIVYASVSGNVHLSSGTLAVQKRVPSPEAVVTCLKWILGTELGFSGRSGSTP